MKSAHPAAPDHHTFRSDLLYPLIGVLIIIALVFTAKVNASKVDSYATLLVSQSIIQNGTIKLDAYADRLFKGHHVLDTFEGHVYNKYPIGTSLFSIPFVYAANIMGYDMINDEAAWQRPLTAITCSLVFILLYLTGTFFVTPRASATIVGVSFFGSSLTSIMGSGLWSHDLAMVFSCGCLYYLVRYETKGTIFNPYLIGVFLFCGYITRPTLSIFIVVTFVYLLYKDKTLLLKTALTSALLLACFSAFSILEFGTLLPYYYRANATFEFHPRAVYGLFLSPSRGLFVFSPFLLLILIGTVIKIRDLKISSIFWFCAVWFALHTLILSIISDWWGGHTYGPRMFTDVIPALIAISFILWGIVRESVSHKALSAIVALYLLSGAASILVHSGQGLYNEYIGTWNERPNINRHPEQIFDWRYPQFLITEEKIQQRYKDYGYMIFDARRGEWVILHQPMPKKDSQ